LPTDSSRALRAVHEILGIAVESSGAVGVAGTLALAERLRVAAVSPAATSHPTS